MTLKTLFITDYFIINYDDSNPIAQSMAQFVLDVCDKELKDLTTWFGLPLGFGTSNRITVTVKHIDKGGGNNGGYETDGSSFINVNYLSGSPDYVEPVTHMVFVNELVEILMGYRDPLRNSWNAGGSDGEGLSQFLGIMRFAEGHYKGYNSFAASWLTSTNGRQDWVNKVENTDGNSESFGCAVLLLFYLKDQLGFSPAQIIQAGGQSLAETYSNLTGDPGNPFGFFTFLVGLAFPLEQAISALVTEQQKDNPFPIFNFQFSANKNSFSKAEVQNSLTKGAFNDSLRLVLEGCSPFMFNQFGLTAPAKPTFGAGSSFSSTNFNQEASVLFQNAALQKAPQQIEFVYDVSFDPTVLNAFTTEPQNEELDSTISINLPITTACTTATPQTLPAKIEITFYGAQDPFFVSFAPGKANQVWAGEDLRVFSAIPGTQPARGGPSFLNNSTAGAFEYITEVLKYLSANYGDPAVKDPFEPSSNVLPDQTYALQGDSSVVPSTAFVNQPGGSTVYNFAVARVRLDGAVNTTTNGPVRVFFRMWSAATPDKTYNDTGNYNSHKSSGLSLPDWPLPAPDMNTFPFFATSNTPAFSLTDNPEYETNGANSQVITIKNSNGQQWAYFGCFLNVYDGNNIIGGDSVIHLLHSAHHCLVAQIAYDDAPIQTPPGVLVAPGHCDKLVQRNLQITLAYNPGLAPTNRISQTFDVPPTDPSVVSDDYAFDKLMIDWGKVPMGSIASVYWPGASAAQVVALADKRYAYYSLIAVDAHTVETEIIRGVTYVPIPPSTGPNLAGLFTIELTPVSRGNNYSVTIHRLSMGRIRVIRPPAITKSIQKPPSHTIDKNLPGAQNVEPTTESARPSKTVHHSPPINVNAIGLRTGPELQTLQQGLSVYRVVTGAFQVNISVRADDEVLPYDEETLSIFKWRQSVTQPSNRWYPVIARYIEYLSGRIDGHGGNAETVPPSQTGLACPLCRKHEHGNGGHRGVDYGCEKCR